MAEDAPQRNAAATYRAASSDSSLDPNETSRMLFTWDSSASGGLVWDDDHWNTPSTPFPTSSLDHTDFDLSSSDITSGFWTASIVIIVIFLLFLGAVALGIWCCYKRYKRSRQKRTNEPVLVYEATECPQPVQPVDAYNVYGQSYSPTNASTYVSSEASTWNAAVYNNQANAGSHSNSSASHESRLPTRRPQQPSAPTLSPIHSDNGPWNDPVIVAARLPYEKLDVNELISRGGYGEVYSGFYNNELVAVKKLLPETRRDMQEIHGFLAEIKLMAQLDHPNIVRFIGVAWDALSDLAVLTEYMVGGDLRGALSQWERDGRAHGLDREKTQMAVDVVFALTYLHSLSPVVVHRDLKSKNILLDDKRTAKLTDFGVSRERSDRTMTAGVGTSLWMAPEVLMGERYDEKADIFSFGVVLSELDTQLMPYAHAKTTADGRVLPDPAILQMVATGRAKVEFSESTPEALKQLGAACTTLEASNRPTAPEVLYKLQQILRAM